MTRKDLRFKVIACDMHPALARVTPLITSPLHHRLTFLAPFITLRNRVSDKTPIPLPEKPAGGWDSIFSSAKMPDLDSVPTSKVYCAHVQYKILPGKREEYARGMDATQGTFYRQQPGCIAYLFGLDMHDENVVLGTAIWSSKVLFESLPKDPKDLEKLNAARQPFRDLLDGTYQEALVVHETKGTYGTTNHDAGFEKDLGWDAIMGEDFKVPDPSQVPTNDLFLLQGTIHVQSGKATEFAKGMEAVQGTFYRSQPGCIEYRIGLDENDENTVLISVIWSSKEDFENNPRDPEDLKNLNKARALFMKMLDGPEQEAMNIRCSSVTFGNVA